MDPSDAAVMLPQMGPADVTSPIAVAAVILPRMPPPRPCCAKRRACSCGGVSSSTSSWRIDSPGPGSGPWSVRRRVVPQAATLPTPPSAAVMLPAIPLAPVGPSFVPAVTSPTLPPALMSPRIQPAPDVPALTSPMSLVAVMAPMMSIPAVTDSTLSAAMPPSIEPSASSGPIEAPASNAWPADAVPSRLPPFASIDPIDPLTERTVPWKLPPLTPEAPTSMRSTSPAASMVAVMSPSALIRPIPPLRAMTRALLIAPVPDGPGGANTWMFPTLPPASISVSRMVPAQARVPSLVPTVIGPATSPMTASIVARSDRWTVTPPTSVYARTVPAKSRPAVNVLTAPSEDSIVAFRSRPAITASMSPVAWIVPPMSRPAVTLSMSPSSALIETLAAMSSFTATLPIEAASIVVLVTEPGSTRMRPMRPEVVIRVEVMSCASRYSIEPAWMVPVTLPSALIFTRSALRSTMVSTFRHPP